MTALILPLDEVTGRRINVDLAADYLELTAFFAVDDVGRASDLANAASVGPEEALEELQDEMDHGEEEIVASAVACIKRRQDVLDLAYPFDLDGEGSTLTCVFDDGSLGHSSYILSLVLSHLSAVTPVLGATHLHPNDNDVRQLRKFFQYAATAALAAEVQGQAWSFGFPRPDGSGFLPRLGEVWQELRDGFVEVQPGAPEGPKDDQIDVFAARSHNDRLPGFLLAAAQVATGANAWTKSLKGHLGAFRSRWFRTQPVTDFIPCMIVPFAVCDEKFVDRVRTAGNVLHRLRVPRRVAEAEQLVRAGVPIEAYDRLPGVGSRVTAYRDRAKAAA